MSAVGYAWIQAELEAPDFMGPRQARVAPVSRIERLPEGSLLVPTKLAPAQDFLSQALFAIKPQPILSQPGEGYLLYRIGDCVAQRNVHAAIYDALRLCKDF